MPSVVDTLVCTARSDIWRTSAKAPITYKSTLLIHWWKTIELQGFRECLNPVYCSADFARIDTETADPGEPITDDILVYDALSVMDSCEPCGWIRKIRSVENNIQADSVHPVSDMDPLNNGQDLISFLDDDESVDLLVDLDSESNENLHTDINDNHGNIHKELGAYRYEQDLITLNDDDLNKLQADDIMNNRSSMMRDDHTSTGSQLGPHYELGADIVECFDLLQSASHLLVCSPTLAHAQSCSTQTELTCFTAGAHTTECSLLDHSVGSALANIPFADDSDLDDLSRSGQVTDCVPETARSRRQMIACYPFEIMNTIAETSEEL